MMAPGDREPTMRDLMSLINKNHESLKEKLEETTAELKTIHNKLLGLDGKIKEVDGRVKSLESNERKMSSKRDVQLAVNHLKDDINESRQRQMRLNNRVIFGIPENDDGLELFEDLLVILAPGDRHKIDFERFGKQNENGRHRPIRMYLLTPYLKRKVLSNLSKLKGIEKFKNVTIRPDLTKQQIISGTPYITRSTPNGGTEAVGKADNSKQSSNKRGADGEYKESDSKRTKKDGGDGESVAGVPEGSPQDSDGDGEDDKTMTED